MYCLRVSTTQQNVFELVPTVHSVVGPGAGLGTARVGCSGEALSFSAFSVSHIGFTRVVGSLSSLCCKKDGTWLKRIV